MQKQEFKVTAYIIDHEELMKAVLQIAGIENGKLMISTSEDGKYLDEQHVWDAWNEVLEEYGINLDQLVV